MKIADFLKELSTWFPPTHEAYDRALASDITTKNNYRFKHLVKMWCDGEYDNNPGTLYHEVVELLY